MSDHPLVEVRLQGAVHLPPGEHVVSERDVPLLPGPVAQQVEDAAAGEPCRGLGWEQGQGGPGDDVGARASPHGEQLGEPVGLDRLVVIDEDDEVRRLRGKRHRGLACIWNAAARLALVSQPSRERGDERCAHVACALVGRVVDDE
jgi:hypothetical protein